MYWNDLKWTEKNFRENLGLWGDRRRNMEADNNDVDYWYMTLSVHSYEMNILRVKEWLIIFKNVFIKIKKREIK